MTDSGRTPIRTLPEAVETAKRLGEFLDRFREMVQEDKDRYEVLPDSYRRMALREAVSSHLRMVKGEMPFEELLSALERGGAELKANPSKNLRTTISMNPERFYWDGDLVGLSEWKSIKRAA